MDESIAIDENARRILRAIGRKIRPYEDKDIAMATKLSRRVVRKHLVTLRHVGLVDDQWINMRQFWELVPNNGA